MIEYVAGGKKTVYHSREYRIMTNDPSYHQQLAYRATFNFDNATRQTPIPGNTDAKDRFIRADYYREWLPEPKNTREAIAAILAIVRNVSVPFGAPNRPREASIILSSHGHRPHEPRLLFRADDQP
ncbi:linear amide C-N hydrolase [Hyphomicrobium sp.]|uniref:linear amide C-N hydrolase n=1 Tax=Hyphomicrobium sp. TaxID=82 RepID=UPI003458FD9F